MNTIAGMRVAHPHPDDKAALDLLKRTAKGFIAYPENLEVVCTYSGDRLTILNLRAHAADSPRLVGRHGLRFAALRLLLAEAGAKAGRELKLDRLMSPVIGEPEVMPPFQRRDDWPKEPIRALLRDCCEALFSGGAEIECRDVGGNAVFTLTISEKEPGPESSVGEKVDCLRSIFSAIGPTNGIQLSIDAKWRDSKFTG